MKKAVALAALHLLLAVSAVAQQRFAIEPLALVNSKTKATLRLGQTRAETINVLGKPAKKDKFLLKSGGGLRKDETQNLMN